jgi:ADP-ribose pyrophosphatase YjhB (NUDIX family)
MDWGMVGGISGAVGLAVTVATLYFTGEWERVNGFRAMVRLSPRAVEVVIGVVTKGDQVLLVHRKPAKGETLHWQFPSGNIRLGEVASDIILREILDETGVQAKFVSRIGVRVHPYNGKRCEYIECAWESGDPLNLDTSENIDVRWVDKSEITAYVPRGLFKKVREHLK